jgi:hypothetical protein
METEKVNLVPRLKDILNGCYDPKGGYVTSPDKLDASGNPVLEQKPWGEGHQPEGFVSLSPQDYAAYTNLCTKVRFKPEGESQEVGGGGAMVAVKDLANCLAKTTAETEILVDVPVPE